MGGRILFRQTPPDAVTGHILARRHSMKSICLWLGAVMAMIPATSFAESHDVTVVAGHPADAPWVRMISDSFIPAAQAELTAAGHDMTFTTQYGGVVAGVGDELEAVGAGQAQIGTCFATRDPAKLSVQNVTYYTPFVSDDPRLIGEVMNELHRTRIEINLAYAENRVVYLGAPITIDDYVLMTPFPVVALDDLQDRKIAAEGAAVAWLAGTGAAAITGNPDTYHADLMAGRVEGVLVPASAALQGNIHKAAPQITKIGLGAQYTGSICVNGAWFNRLPAEIQLALVTAADTAKDWYHDELAAFADQALTQMAADGATVTEASPALRAAWAEGMDNAATAWAAALDAQGKPASLILNSYMDAMRAAGAMPLRDWDSQ
jgi:TRAP-type C4-dicarboxylate transport system substrate-binding protein